MQEFETSEVPDRASSSRTASRSSAGRGDADRLRRHVEDRGSPSISLGSDIDGIPQANNKPAFGFFEPLVTGRARARRGTQLRPGGEHRRGARGEGDHGAREDPGHAGALAGQSPRSRWRGRRSSCAPGVFKDVDVALFTHVGNDLGVSWGVEGPTRCLGAVQVQGHRRAHAAGAPWRGKSALDAVMLMGQGGSSSASTSSPQQRSHYVIKDGGDQPNVVPQTASIWFYFRERDYRARWRNFAAGKRDRRRRGDDDRHEARHGHDLGSAWSGHFNKADRRGDARQHRARRACQVGRERPSRWPRGCRRSWVVTRRGWRRARSTRGRPARERGWAAAPTTSATCRGTSRRSPCAIRPTSPDAGAQLGQRDSMATPIAHKGGGGRGQGAGATILDIAPAPKVVADAWDYFNQRPDQGRPSTVVPRP
jgi:aminobenzoyl-glutamate utilization protein B